MSLPQDIHVTGGALYWLPISTRVPLKFGPETVTSVTCARVQLRVENRLGQSAIGWGETPLSVQWVWPSSSPYEIRHQHLKAFCADLLPLWVDSGDSGHPLEIGHRFQVQGLHTLWESYQSKTPIPNQPIPWLAALVANSLFDIALHDAYGNLLKQPTYDTYTADHLNQDLSYYLKPNPGSPVSFQQLYPNHFFEKNPAKTLKAWHLVGGLDPLTPEDLTGNEPNDSYPVLLRDWIRRDGLQCLKVKLRGNDYEWDLNRLIQVGAIAVEENCQWLTADFNCTVQDPSYVNQILDHLKDRHPRLYGMLLYVEQPFPYELEHHQIDVHSVSARKPLFLDESAHDWKLVQLGRQLGWTGVALKTCKTQTGAILSAAWAKAHGMTLMVQDLTNPMLAQIPHLTLASQVGTIMGVESNSMQFYPEASAPEAKVHRGLYQRKSGCLDLSSLGRTGMGYRIEEIQRKLPEAVKHCGSV